MSYEQPEVKKQWKEHSPEWEREANAMARGRLQMKPCRNCGGPVFVGYCCEHCGSALP